MSRRGLGLGRAIARLAERTGILADEETSRRLSAVDDELDAAEVRRRIGHGDLPLIEDQERTLVSMHRAVAGDFDGLADLPWEGEPIR